MYACELKKCSAVVATEWENGSSLTVVLVHLRLPGDHCTNYALMISLKTFEGHIVECIVTAQQ